MSATSRGRQRAPGESWIRDITKAVVLEVWPDERRGRAGSAVTIGVVVLSAAGVVCCAGGPGRPLGAAGVVLLLACVLILLGVQYLTAMRRASALYSEPNPHYPLPAALGTYVYLVIAFAAIYYASGPPDSRIFATECSHSIECSATVNAQGVTKHVHNTNCRARIPLASWQGYVWFSFVTGSTLGYGERLPSEGLAYWVVCIQLLAHFALIGITGATVVVMVRSIPEADVAVRA